MPDLKAAITVVEIIIGIIVVLALGDFIGDKIGRRRLIMILLGVALVMITLFAIYAAIILA